MPTIAFIIDGMLNEAQEQHRTLSEVRDKPHVLDDATVDRVLEVYTTQLEDIWLFDEQLSRWKKGRLDPVQRQEVGRLTKEVEELREACQQIISLAAEIKKGTIDRILEKSDFELGMDILTGKTKPPEK